MADTNTDSAAGVDSALKGGAKEAKTIIDLMAEAVGKAEKLGTAIQSSMVGPLEIGRDLMAGIATGNFTQFLTDVLTGSQTLGPSLQGACETIVSVWNSITGALQGASDGIATALGGLVIALCEKLGPGIKVVADMASGLARIIGGALVDAINSVGSFIASAITTVTKFGDILQWVAAAIGVVLVGYAIGSFISAIPTIIGGVVALIGQFALWAAGAWSAATATIAAVGPTIVIGLAVAALIAIIITLALTFKELGTCVGQVFQVIKQIIVGSVEMLIGLFKNFGRILKGVFSRDPAEIKAGIDGAKREMAGFKDVVAGEAGKIGGALSQYGQAVVTNVGNMVQGVKDKLTLSVAPAGIPDPKKPATQHTQPPFTPSAPAAVTPVSTQATSETETPQTSKLQQLQQQLEYYQRIQDQAYATGRGIAKANQDVANIERQIAEENKRIANDEYREKVRLGKLTAQERITELEKLMAMEEAGSEQLKALEKEKADLANGIEREQYDFKVQMGQLSTEEQIAQLDKFIAREQAGSDEYKRLQIEKNRLEKQLSDERRTLNDNEMEYRYKNGKLSTEEYIAYLQKKQSAEKAYSQEWLALQQKIKELQEQQAAEQESWLVKVGKTLRDKVISSVKLGQELWSGLTTGNWTGFLIGIITSTESFKKIVDRLNSVMERVIQIADALLEPIFALVDGLIGAFDPLLGMIVLLATSIGGMLQPVIDMVVGLLNQVMAVLNPIFQVMFPLITAALMPFAGILEFVCKGIGLIAKILYTLVYPIVKVITGIWNAVLSALAGIDIFGWKPFAKLADSVIELPGEQKEDATKPASSTSSSGTQISELTGPSRDLLVKLLTPLSSLTVLTGAMNTVRDALMQAQNTLLNIFSVVGAVRDMLQSYLYGMVSAAAESTGAGMQAAVAGGGGVTLYVNQVTVERLENEADFLKMMQKARAGATLTKTSGGVSYGPTR